MLLLKIRMMSTMIMNVKMQTSKVSAHDKLRLIYHRLKCAHYRPPVADVLCYRLEIADDVLYYRSAVALY